jgi:hypothetical protein
MHLPANNTIVVFAKVPAGSYASVGTPYRVTHFGKGRSLTINLTNTIKGSSTQDRAPMYARAEWALAQ